MSRPASAPDMPQWSREGADWPNAEHSRFVRAGGIEWHVQVAGQGPDLVLLHGVGAATHSFRDLVAPLAASFRVIVPDLPGHGFTQRPAMNGLTLPGMARLTAALLAALDARPLIVAGHSAGAAILCRMTLDGDIAPRTVVSVNGAFLPFPGLAGQVFPPLARALALNPLAPRFFSWGARADPASIERLITGTGSRLSPEGLELYRRLLRCHGHVTSALRMMAGWDLEPLVRDLPALDARLVLAAGEEDRAVPLRDAEAVAARVHRAEVVRLPGLGHLAHEEAPGRIVTLIVAEGRAAGLLPAAASPLRVVS